MTAETVILCAGDFPRRGGEAWKLLAAASCVVACDGAARSYRRHFKRWPDVIVGDMDSIGRVKSATSRIVRVDEQETNDLEKAVRFCRDDGLKNVVVVGATGRREDHTIGNVFRALALAVPVVTDFGVFMPVDGQASFDVPVGTPVSVFAPDRETKMKSSGLKWPLDGVTFDTLARATLNRTTATTFTVTADRPVMVYCATER